MALPVAHTAIALGSTRSRDPRILAFLSVLSFAPDFDFFFVWVLGFPIDVFHRTFSHSVPSALLLTIGFALFRPAWLKDVSPGLFFLVLSSHGLLDMLCTANVTAHGVMPFWPFTESRWGWPVLVPLYRLVGESPFTPGGALRFTLLELVLAAPFFLVARAMRRSAEGVGDRIVSRVRARRGELGARAGVFDAPE